MSKLFFIIVSLTLLSACEKSINSGEIPISSKYPTQLNREWEYNTTIRLEFYDSTGHIDSTELMDSVNTICKIIRVNDTIGDFKNLVLFEEYDVLTPQNVHKLWYLNADSGLYAIAYSNPGASQTIVPKANIKSYNDFINMIKLIGLSPASYLSVSSNDQINDTSFYSYPRKVLQYPLRIGERWIELIEPFYRERFIKDKTQITINGNTYNCFKVESEWDWNIVFTDYINFSNGLVMREVIFDSIAIIGTEDPNPLGYYKISSVSKLVRETKQ
ncbi:MAG: hypothetical protein LDL01_06775 [Ignavibacterium sp.]|nr:hypothetical protein [Ignavibacterium sp.]